MNKLLQYRRVIFWLFILMVMLLWIGRNLQVQSDLSLFLPKQQSLIDSLLIHQLNEGSASRTIFISIQGSSLAQRVTMSRQLVEKLQRSLLFSQVFNGTQQLTDDEINWLLNNRYLLSPDITDGYFSSLQLTTAFRQRFEELAMPVPAADKQYLPRDPTASLRSILKRLNKKNTLSKHEGVWVSDDTEQAFIITQTAGGAVDLDSQQQVVDLIRVNFQQLKTEQQDYDESLQILLTGLPVASTLSRKLIQQESRLFSVIASVALLLILYLGFRSGKLVLLSSLPLFSAVITGLFTVLAWFGSIHGITLVFAITILGIALDYPLHLFSHLDPKQSPASSMLKIWSTMRIGLLTTVMAFMTLVFSNFDGLFQLGLFTASGLVMAALTTRFILPVLIGSTKPVLQLKVFSLNISTRVGWIAITAGLLFSLGVMSQQLPQWEKNLSSLSPLPDSYLQRDKQLRSLLSVGELRYIAVIQGATMEHVLQLSEQLGPELDKLVEQKIIRQYDFAANYLPSESLQNERRAELPDAQQLDANLSEALTELPFRKGLFQPFLEDVESARNQRNINLNDLQTLPFEPVVKSLLMEHSDSYFGIIHFSGLTDVDKLQQQIKARLSDEEAKAVTVQDLQQISSSLLIRFYADFLIRVVLAMGIIMLILLMSLRNLARTLVVTSVLLLSLLVELSILVALGQHLTLFHLVSLILVFGLGLDYALFFTRDEALADKQKTLYGLMICAFSSILVFGILALSKIPVLHIIGMTTAIGVLLAFLFSMLMTSLVLQDKTPA